MVTHTCKYIETLGQHSLKDFFLSTIYLASMHGGPRDTCGIKPMFFTCTLKIICSKVEISNESIFPLPSLIVITKFYSMHLFNSTHPRKLFFFTSCQLPVEMQCQGRIEPF